MFLLKPLNCLSDLTSVPGNSKYRLCKFLCVLAHGLITVWSLYALPSSFSFIPLKYEFVTLFIWLNVFAGHPLVLGFV